MVILGKEGIAECCKGPVQGVVINFPSAPAPDGLKHAWFSAKQATIGGTSIYRTETGAEIEISMVGTSPGPPGFDDTTYKGLVVAAEKGGWVRQCQRGSDCKLRY